VSLPSEDVPRPNHLESFARADTQLGADPQRMLGWQAGRIHNQGSQLVLAYDLS
jgi:hypothetical protein